MGPYRLDRANFYVTMARRLELKPVEDTFEDFNKFHDAIEELPEDLLLHARHMPDQPDDWEENSMGLWPHGGVLCVYLTFPSANRSMSSR